MKTPEQIGKMIEAVRAMYDGLPDRNKWGESNVEEGNYVVNTLQRVLDEGLDELNIMKLSVDEKTDRKEKHQLTAELLDWVVDMMPDEHFESDWGYKEDK